MAALRAEQPMGRFNWLGTYTNASHLAFAEVAQIWRDAPGIGAALKAMMNLPFYKALFFTVIYTAIVTPLVIILGFLIALAVNGVPKILKGPVIFFSLLPMIVTPLIGRLVLFWMIDSRGVIGATLQLLFDDPELSLKASPTLTWLVLLLLRRLAPRAVQLHRLLRRPADRSPTTRSSRRWSTAPAAGSASASSSSRTSRRS